MKGVRANIIAFYIRNSRISNGDLVKIILLAVEQLYWQGGPNILKRVKVLLFGRSGSHRG